MSKLLFSKQMLTIGFALFWALIAAPTFLSQEVKDQKEPPNSQEPSIKIGTNLISVPVIVSDRYGRFISGLSRNDFTIREEGVVQKVDTLYSEADSFNVALLIDTSRSTQNKLGAIRKAASAFIKQLQPRDRVMIVTFDEKVRFITEFTNNQANLDRAVSRLKTSYLTSLYEAIYLTIMEKMNPIQGRKAIVVLTDGVDTASQHATFESSLELVSRTGIIAYAIQYETRNDGGTISRPIFYPRPNSSFTIESSAKWQNLQMRKIDESSKSKEEVKVTTDMLPVNNVPSPGLPSQAFDARPLMSIDKQSQTRDRYLIAADYLRTLALQSGAQYIRAENIENTTYAFRVIAEELRHQYTLTYISNNEQQSSAYRTISVGVNRRDAIVRARLGYRAPKN